MFCQLLLAAPKVKQCKMILSKTWLFLIIEGAVNAVTLNTYQGYPGSTVSVSDSVTGVTMVSKGRFFRFVAIDD